MSQLRVLLTGASGQVGQCLLPTFQTRYALRTLDRRSVPGDPHGIVADLKDFAALKSALEGTDVLVHLAASASPNAPFVEELLPNNILGVFHLFQAARETGVRRIVFASSCETVLQYPEHQTVEITDPPRAPTPYGVTKVFGEVLGRQFHDAYGMEFIALRLGAFVSHLGRFTPPRMRLVWLGRRDAIQLFQLAIEKPGIGYAIVFGTSKTEREHLSLKSARELLGFEPQDSVADAITGPVNSPPVSAPPPATAGH